MRAHGPEDGRVRGGLCLGVAIAVIDKDIGVGRDFERCPHNPLPHESPLIDHRDLITGGGIERREPDMADTNTAAPVDVPAWRHGEIIDRVEQFRGDVGVSPGSEARAARVEGRNLVPVVAGFEFEADRNFRQLETERTRDNQAVVGRKRAGGRRGRNLVHLDVVLPIPPRPEPNVESGARRGRAGEAQHRRASKHKCLQFHGKTRF